MSGFWQVWCPVCCRLRPSRIPANAPSSVVVAEYDAHLKRHRGRVS